jgi:hypothetical protein
LARRLPLSRQSLERLVSAAASSSDGTNATPPQAFVLDAYMLLLVIVPEGVSPPAAGGALRKHIAALRTCRRTTPHVETLRLRLGAGGGVGAANNDNDDEAALAPLLLDDPEVVVAPPSAPGAPPGPAVAVPGTGLAAFIQHLRAEVVHALRS